MADVTPEMTSYKEEIFGPVASIIKVKDVDEAIELANKSDFGLCWAVYWDDSEEILEAAKRIETCAQACHIPTQVWSSSHGRSCLQCRRSIAPAS